MATQISITHSPLKKPTNSFTFQEIRKKAFEIKNNNFDKFQGNREIKTSAFLQIPAMDFSTFHSSQRLTPRKNQTSRTSLRKIQVQKFQRKTMKYRSIQTERPKKMNKIENSDQKKHLSTLKNFIIPQSMVFEKNSGKIKKFSSSMYVKAVSNNLLESFRAVFNELIETYFTQIFLRKKISHLKIEVWNYILKKADTQIGNQKHKLQYQQIDKKIFCLGIKNSFSDQFKPIEVQNMVNKYFSNEPIIFYSQFEKILTFEKDCINALIERSYDVKYASLRPPQMVKFFLKSLIKFADLQKKLLMISKANEFEVIKFISSVSDENSLQIQKFSIFLELNNRPLKERTVGLKQEEIKLIDFLNKVLREKLTKIQFIKWLKLQEQPIV